MKLPLSSIRAPFDEVEDRAKNKGNLNLAITSTFLALLALVVQLWTLLS